MREDLPKDLLVELYNFNQENRLDFYAFVRIILAQSQCAIISKPYWPVIDGYPGSEVFTIFPDLECPSCDGEYKCQDVSIFTTHIIQCQTREGISKMRTQEDLNMYRKYGIVPKTVKKNVEDARNERDMKAVCIAPVNDHPQIRGMADLQRKERERKLTDLVNEEESRGPHGPIIKLGNGAEMPLDRMVWIQTPLTSELATLLLAGMQPIRHSSRGIHLPIILRDMGVNKVIHLHVDRFEELAAVRMAQKSWEEMKLQIQNFELYDTIISVAPSIPDIMKGQSKDTFKKMIGRSLSLKRPHDPISENTFTEKMINDIQAERRKVEAMKRKEEEAIDRIHTIENEREREKSRAAAKKSASSNSIDSNKKVNGDSMSIDERPGCSKYTA